MYPFCFFFLADPCAWSPSQVHAWLQATIQQFRLPSINNLESKFNEDGTALLMLSEEEFIKRVPEVRAFYLNFS